MRSDSAKFFALRAAARSAISCSMRAASSPALEGNAWRNALGSRCNNPSVAASDYKSFAFPGARVRLISLARSNSTATASGVLKSSFIDSRKLEA